MQIRGRERTDGAEVEAFKLPRQSVSIIKAVRLFPRYRTIPPRADLDGPSLVSILARCGGALAAVPCLALPANILIRMA